MKYITYKTNYNGKQLLIPGGMGHSLTDYLSSYIVSKLYPDVIFLHNKLRFNVEIQKNLGFSMDLEEDPYLWNDFLNLDYFDKKINQDNIKHKFICMSADYMSIDLNNLNNIINEVVKNDIIYCLTNNNRIYLYDL